MTVDAIAQQAGISKGNLYWYFKSKQEIFRLLADCLVERLLSRVIETELSDMPPRDKLRALARRCLEAAQADPEAVRVMWQIATQPELKGLLSQEFSLWISPFITDMTALFAELGEREPEAVATLYAFTLDALMILVAIGPGIYDMAKLIAAVEEKFLGPEGGRDV